MTISSPPLLYRRRAGVFRDPGVGPKPADLRQNFYQYNLIIPQSRWWRSIVKLSNFVLHPLDTLQHMLYADTKMQHKNYYTTTELGKIMGLNRSQVYRKIKSGEIPAVKAGRYNLVPRFYVDSLLGELEKDDKKRIQSAVNKTIKQYGEVIKMLGDK